MTQKVPSPFESTNDAKSFFNELVGQSSGSQGQGQPFSLDGFSSDAVLDMFRDETNAMLKGEISKIKDLSELQKQSFELRMSSWKDRLEGAIDKIDARISILANIQAPQRREAQRRDDEEKRPVAFALLKAIRSGLLQQTAELSKMQQELVAARLTSEHADLVHQLYNFLQTAQDPKLVQTRFEQFLRTIFLSYKNQFGLTGLQGLAQFMKGVESQIPPQFLELFRKEFLRMFQEMEQAQVTMGGGRMVDIPTVLTLHEKLAPTFAPNEPGVGATIMDESGIILHYFRGLANTKGNVPLNENTQIPQGQLSKQFLAMLVAFAVDQKLFQLEDEFQNLMPEFKNATFTYENEPQKITVGDLIKMKSGLPDLDTLAHLMGKDPSAMTADEKLELLKQFSELGFKPGLAEKATSDTNMLLLAKLIEKKTGMTIEQYAKEKLFGENGLNLAETSFGTMKKPLAMGFRYNEAQDIWEAKPMTKNEPYEVTTTIKDLAVWNQNLLNNKLGDDPELISELVKESLGAEEKSIFNVSSAAGFSLLFFGVQSEIERRQFSLFLATNREDFVVNPVAKEIAEAFTPIPFYGLAFVPFPTASVEVEAIDELADNAKLEEQIRRFEGTYRSEQLVSTWRLVCQKNIVSALNKEYWGLQVSGADEQLFFIPTEITDEKATFILADRPTCVIVFSKEGFSLTDPVASIKNVIFKKLGA